MKNQNEQFDDILNEVIIAIIVAIILPTLRYLYNCIKFDYKELINLLIEYNKTNIGISIIDMKDRLGLTALHYSVIFNNYEAFITLLKNKSNPYLISNDGSNIFILSLQVG